MAFDDNIFVDRDRLWAILTGIRARGHHLKWWVELRVDQVLEMSSAELDEFHRLGIEIAYVGVESGSDRILKLLGKGITTDDTREANRRLAATGISTCYSFIIGAPTEEREETLQTVDLARELLETNPQSWLWQFNQYSPFPGTPLYAMALREGFRPYRTLDDWEVGWTFKNMNPSSTTFTDEEMACISYAGLFQKPDRFLANRSLQYKAIFRAFRAVFAQRLKRHLFTPFLDTWAIGRLYAAAEARNRRYAKQYFEQIE
jgi:radical SAM superfamily enzyme YgiQ (UPF0313 family)